MIRLVLTTRTNHRPMVATDWMTNLTWYMMAMARCMAKRGLLVLVAIFIDCGMCVCMCQKL